MTSAEALRVIAMLTAYFRQELSDETAALWAQEIRPENAADGIEAARVLATTQRFLPTLADFRAQVIDCRNERLVREALVLPPGEEEVMSWSGFLRQNPDVRERAEKSMGWFKRAVDDQVDA